MRLLPALLLSLVVVGPSMAHDIWVEPSSNVVRVGEWVRLSLMLGNHGNEHRDFRLASKVAAGDQNLTVIDPTGKRYDLTSSLTDTGYTPQEGFWSARFIASSPGLYTAVSVMDKVMSYAPVRDIKCAKTYFVASKSLDQVPEGNPGFEKSYGARFELVPVVNPVTPFGPGTELRVKLLFEGKPMAGVKVSFIPRGAEAKGETDPLYEKVTGADGTVGMSLKESNTYLISAHYTDKAAAGEGYKSINYSATLCLVVPAICPCCGGL